MTLTVKNLHFSYGDVEILKGLDLEMDKGILSILGPNGAGKSTLMKCLAGIHKPSEGTATFNDHNLLMRDEGLKIAYMSQENPHVSSITVLEVMLLGRLEKLGIKVSKEDLDAAYGAMKELDLQDLALKHMNELSGGQCQMVMIAQCMVSDPDLIILDEPMNNLDLRRELEMFDIMKRITVERDITTVMVLHDINFASRFSDKIAVLKDGIVHSAGVPSDVITQDMIRDVYGVEAKVTIDDGRPLIQPLHSLPNKDPRQSP